jgi:hypothetical protein
LGKKQAVAVTGREEAAFVPAVPDGAGGMDDPFTADVESARQHGLSRGAGRGRRAGLPFFGGDFHAGFVKARPRGPVDRPVNAAAAGKGGVRRVYDNVNVNGGYVALDYFNRGHTIPSSWYDYTMKKHEQTRFFS